MAHRHDAQRHLMFCALANESTWCFANASTLAGVWALLSSTEIDSEQLTIGGDSICLSLHAMMSEPINITDLYWFHKIMTNWTGGSGQADAAEYTQLMLQELQLPDLCQEWEKRYLDTQTGIIKRSDHSDQFSPIILQFPEDYNSKAIGFPALLQPWMQDMGMTTALCSPSPVVCFHVDRWIQHPHHGTLYKTAVEILSCSECQLPIFVNGTEVMAVPYVLCAVVLHFGTSNQGHYQTLLRLHSDTAHEDEPLEWLLTDDNSAPVHVTGWHSWMAGNVSLLWYTRQDLVELPTCPERARHQLLALLTS